MGAKRAVFVDRDGTLNEMVYDANHGVLDSPRRPDQVKLIPGAGLFLKGIRNLGFLAIVVTNQPGVAKGTLTIEALQDVNRRLEALLAKEGAAWDDLRFSPYHPDGGPWANSAYVRVSNCRKPEPGMLLDAANEYGIDLPSSWMIGDGLTDIQAGKAAGCKTILLTKLKLYHIEKFLDLKDAEPDYSAASLEEALGIIRGSTVAGQGEGKAL